MYLCTGNKTTPLIMPRQERQQSATGIYHVMLRGINKQDIFEDEEDYLQFLKILRGMVERYDENGILDVDYGTGGKLTDDDIKEKIAMLSGLHIPTEVRKLEKSERNIILKQLCEYGANVRKISRITGISYGVIFRAKSGS